MNEFPTPADEFAVIVADAASSDGKSPRERIEILRGLLATVDALWAGLTLEERARRMRIYDELNASPNPWWKNLRPEAIPPV